MPTALRSETLHVTPLSSDRDYPQLIAEANRVEPAPRRVRATLGGEQIFDTVRARYVWEWPFYPQYYIPVDDIDMRFLVDEQHDQHLRQGTARRHGLRAGGQDRPGTPLASPTYAATCRGRKVGQRPRLEIWAYPLVVGRALPTLPIWLQDDLAVALDLEASYEETCLALRIR